LTTPAQILTGAPSIGTSGSREISPWAYQGQFPDGNLSGRASREVDIWDAFVDPYCSEISSDRGCARANTVTKTKEADIPNKITDIIRMLFLFLIFSSPPNLEDSVQLETDVNAH
jgi:hypothetical protein